MAKTVKKVAPTKAAPKKEATGPDPELVELIEEIVLASTAGQAAGIFASLSKMYSNVAVSLEKASKDLEEGAQEEDEEAEEEPASRKKVAGKKTVKHGR